MLKLKLNVVQVSHGIEIDTSLRIFDQKSLDAALIAIRSGCLGRRSRASYFLVGFYYDQVEGQWIRISPVPLFGKMSRQSVFRFGDITLLTR